MTLYETFDSGRTTQIERMLPADLRTARKLLTQRFAEEAVIVDSTTGFIRVAFMNQRDYIDSTMLAIQADILSYIFRDTHPTRIIGIPDSGLPLAHEVTKRFPLARLVMSAKENGKSPEIWPRITISVYSFTEEKNMNMAFEPIEPDQRYLIVDDVIAHGSAGVGVIEGITNRGGTVVGLAAGFEKKFQGGSSDIARRFGIPVASVVSIVGLTPDKKRVILSHA